VSNFIDNASLPSEYAAKLSSPTWSCNS